MLILLKDIKYWQVVFFSFSFYFFENDLFSEWWKGILEVLEIRIFFPAQPWLADLHRISSTLFPWILHFGGGISISFLKMKKVKNLYISLSTIIRDSQNVQQEKQTKKAINHEGVCKLDNLFKPTVNLC